MKENKLSEKLTEIIETSKKSNLENRLDDFCNRKDFTIEFLEKYVFNEACKSKTNLSNY